MTDSVPVHGDCRPNLAGYNVIAVETAKYLVPLLEGRKKATPNNP